MVTILKVEPGGWGAEKAMPASARTSPFWGSRAAIPPSRPARAVTAAAWMRVSIVVRAGGGRARLRARQDRRAGAQLAARGTRDLLVQRALEPARADRGVGREPARVGGEPVGFLGRLGDLAGDRGARLVGMGARVRRRPRRGPCRRATGCRRASGPWCRGSAAAPAGEAREHEVGRPVDLVVRDRDADGRRARCRIPACAAAIGTRTLPSPRPGRRRGDDPCGRRRGARVGVGLLEGRLRVLALGGVRRASSTSPRSRRAARHG